MKRAAMNGVAASSELFVAEASTDEDTIPMTSDIMGWRRTESYRDGFAPYRKLRSMP